MLVLSSYPTVAILSEINGFIRTIETKAIPPTQTQMKSDFLTDIQVNALVSMFPTIEITSNALKETEMGIVEIPISKANTKVKVVITKDFIANVEGVEVV